MRIQLTLARSAAQDGRKTLRSMSAKRWGENVFEPRILYLAKLSMKTEAFSNMQELRPFTTYRPILEELLKQNKRESK